MPGSIGFVPDEADYVSASLANCRCQLRKSALWIRLALSAAGLAVLAAVILADDIIEGLIIVAASAAAGFLAGLICIAVSYLLLPRRSRRIYRQQRSLRQEQRVAWDDSRLHWEGPGFTMDVPWSDYHRWHESRAEFLLYVNEQMPHFLPRRAMDEDQAADLRATLVAHGPPRR